MQSRSAVGLLTVIILVLALWTEPILGRSIQAQATPLRLQSQTLPPPSLADPSASPSPSALAAPIVVTESDVTLDGLTITSTGRTGTGIQVSGTPFSHVRNLTIRNCVISGFDIGIEARYVTNLIIENCSISDAYYAGIAVYSGLGGRITGNTVRRIGLGRTDMTAPYVENNAYGITLDRSTAGNMTSDPRSTGFVVDRNVVEDVPLWMGINIHAGARITISNNTVRRTPRAIFIAGDTVGNPPQTITVTGNRLEEAVTVPGGTTDIEGILISALQGGSITDNIISRTYGIPGVYDYLGKSTNVTVAGQVSIP